MCKIKELSKRCVRSHKPQTSPEMMTYLCFLKGDTTLLKLKALLEHYMPYTQRNAIELTKIWLK